MPALVAIRHNADLKAKYTAVMRKLLVLANALLRDNRKWAEKIA
jgi:transposase